MTDWTPHNGGPCPVDPETKVDLKFRCGSIYEGQWAKSFPWSHSTATSGGDITAYRVISPEPNWREIADELAAALKTAIERLIEVEKNTEHYARSDDLEAAITTYNQAKERAE